MRLRQTLEKMRPRELLTKCARYITNADYRFKTNALLGMHDDMSDKEYLRGFFRGRMGYEPNFLNPTTFSEKLQWLKLHDRRPEYTMMVDKYAVKEWVSKVIGKEYVIPAFGVWNHFDEIRFDTLPKQFVLKCTHDCGGNVICKEKARLDIAGAKTKLEASLRHNYYYETREWPYKDVPPRILAEAYVEDSATHDARDYKFFCFDGVMRAMFIATERTTRREPFFDFFDAEGHHLPIRQGHPNAKVPPTLPTNFEKMKRLAEKLAAGIPHVRVDFYEIDGRVYFGEMTFSHFSGMVPFEPPEWDKIFGDWLKLPVKKSRYSK